MTATVTQPGVRSRPGPIVRVASVPSSHVYVRHLAGPDYEDGVLRLPDPEPADGRTVPGGWWPPLMLEPGWVRRNHRSFDVFHIHFGFDTISPAALTDLVGELRDLGKPLIYTVHDLRNPHQPDSSGHREQLDVLIPAADELITLTPGAAAAIESRWERTAHVLRHPHVLTPHYIVAPRQRRSEFTIGVHVKSLRANMDPFPVLDVLAATVPQLPGARLRINVHDELFEPDNHWYAPDKGAALLDFGKRPGVEVYRHDYFTDAQLWRYLSSLSVSVLPYRFGTHSGWLEACYDLGTAVVAPSCGYYRQQRPCGVFDFTETRFDPDSLAEAVHAAYREPAPRADWFSRRAERSDLARRHRELYDRALAS